MTEPTIYPSLQYLAHLEADLIRAERAVVLLRNLVAALSDDRDAYLRTLTAARAYLAELDAADADMV